ncbi:UvrD-helicase domain-containing protein [Pantoea coffeiphila]|uniref:Helicase IV n=1 Tax=Pantoea coffeiphila TaxID=1465635 RepID=A0A2S9I875_9GAMM|nr:UvrD-helicase domain-containing protein [Pantoea coffeiphila]PRD14003.1 helicase IV [Pantoea coffeiphila]
MIEVHTVGVNFLGKLLRKPSVYASSEAIWFSKKGENVAFYPLQSMRAFASVHNAIAGSRLHLNVNGVEVRTGFLKSSSTSEFLETLNRSISVFISDYLSRVFTEFNLLVEREYPRDSWSQKIDELLSELHQHYQRQPGLWKLYLPPSEVEHVETLLSFYPLDMSKVRAYHEALQLKKRSVFFDSVESNPLTSEQRLGVLRSNDRNMVLAAAGTGKTSVMVAKALDLIDRGLAEPTEILVLAYNRAAANELKERLASKALQGGVALSTQPHISTFHALGRQLLREAGISTEISVFAEDDYKFKQWVTKWIYEYISADPSRVFELIELTTPPVDALNFKTKTEYEKYIRDNEFRTLGGEKVRGYQELLIANFLHVNKIEYEYEAQYVTKKRLEVGFDYRPDFHIKGTNVYIEHYGVDRKGNTRPDIDASRYSRVMNDKRKLHEDCGTVLLETFHYEWQEQSLLTELKRKLNSAGIACDPMSPKEIFEKINDQQELASWAGLLSKALQSIRVEMLDKKAISERLKNAKIFNAKKYTEILDELHQGYIEELKQQNAIDFDDMIIRAIAVIQDDKYTPRWKYILVDEFQDISSARMQFIQSLIEKGPSPSLTVVGDDWQSIYRFSGGKLELTTRFGELIGDFTLTKLQKTFRYNNSIAKTAGAFIMQNPEQYTKEIETHHQVTESQVYLLDDKVGVQAGIYQRALEVVKKIRQHEPEAKIAIIARYNYLLDEVKQLIWGESFKENILFWSFHKSKGLESDYCILIGFSHGKTGFPNENRDDAMIEALLPSLDSFKHSEERRLLYVGITRARKKCYIIADPSAPSDFVNELLAPKFEINISSETFKSQYRSIFKCPSCEGGYFRLIKGSFGDFYACTSGLACKVRKVRVCSACSSPSIDTRSQSECNNKNCKTVMKICEVCGRPMRERESRFGKFWGCSGYGLKEDQCTHKSK